MHALNDAGPEDLLQELHRLLLGDVLSKVGVLLEALVQPVDGLGAAEAVLDRLHADPVPLARHARVERADDLVPESRGAPWAADHAAVRHAALNVCLSVNRAFQSRFLKGSGFLPAAAVCERETVGFSAPRIGRMDDGRGRPGAPL